MSRTYFSTAFETFVKFLIYIMDRTLMKSQYREGSTLGLCEFFFRERLLLCSDGRKSGKGNLVFSFLLFFVDVAVFGW